jgi:hypothetical protein
MKFNKKDWKVTDCGETISIQCLNPVIDTVIDQPEIEGISEEITHLEDQTIWPANNWFRKNFHLCKNLKKDTKLIPADGDCEVIFHK